MDLQGSDALVCPICGHAYDVSVEEWRAREGLGIENADREQCDECNEPFLVIEYNDFYSIEEILEEDDDEDYDD